MTEIFYPEDININNDKDVDIMFELNNLHKQQETESYYYNKLETKLTSFQYQILLNQFIRNIGNNMHLLKKFLEYLIEMDDSDKIESVFEIFEKLKKRNNLLNDDGVISIIYENIVSYYLENCNMSFFKELIKRYSNEKISKIIFLTIFNSENLPLYFINKDDSLLSLFDESNEYIFRITTETIDTKFDNFKIYNSSNEYISDVLSRLLEIESEYVYPYVLSKRTQNFINNMLEHMKGNTDVFFCNNIDAYYNSSYKNNIDVFKYILDNKLSYFDNIIKYLSNNMKKHISDILKSKKSRKYIQTICLLEKID